MKTKVTVSQEMMKGAKAAYLHYVGIPPKESKEKFQMLEKVIDELFGEQEPSEAWQEYSRQYQAYVKSEE